MKINFTYSKNVYEILKNFNFMYIGRGLRTIFSDLNYNDI